MPDSSCFMCGYELAGVPLREDSQLICPECGQRQPVLFRSAEFRPKRLSLKSPVSTAVLVGLVPIGLVLAAAATDTGWGRLGKLVVGVPSAAVGAGFLGIITGAVMETRQLSQRAPHERLGFRAGGVILPCLAALVFDGVIGLVGAVLVEMLPGSGGC